MTSLLSCYTLSPLPFGCQTTGSTSLSASSEFTLSCCPWLDVSTSLSASSEFTHFFLAPWLAGNSINQPLSLLRVYTFWLQYQPPSPAFSKVTHSPFPWLACNSTNQPPQRLHTSPIPLWQAGYSINLPLSLLRVYTLLYSQDQPLPLLSSLCSVWRRRESCWLHSSDPPSPLSSASFTLWAVK